MNIAPEDAGEALEWACGRAFALEALCELAPARECAPQAYDFLLHHLTRGLACRLDELRARHVSAGAGLTRPAAPDPTARPRPCAVCGTAGAGNRPSPGRPAG